jgi:uncharacterized protein YqeY
MSLKDRITDDMKAAMRAKDSARLGAIRMLTAAMKQKEVDERIELDDAAVVAIVDKLIKQRKDSVEAFQKAARTDLADKEAAEIVVLQAYLPARMSPEEIQAEVRAIVAELGASGAGDMGKVMAAAKSRFAGKADILYKSVDKNFKGAVINCMDMTADAYLNFGTSAVARAVEDYFPYEPGESYDLQRGNAAAHVAQAVYNSIYFSQMVFPDFDMFQSHNPNGAFHAIARTLNNGPIYLTDVAGQAKLDILNKIVFKDGKKHPCIIGFAADRRLLVSTTRRKAI